MPLQTGLTCSVQAPTQALREMVDRLQSMQVFTGQPSQMQDLLTLQSTGMGPELILQISGRILMPVPAHI